MRTPSPASVRSRNSAMSRLRSRSSNSTRMRSISALIGALADQVGPAPHDQPFGRLAGVLPQGQAAFDQVARQRIDFLPPVRDLARRSDARRSDRVRPSAMALRKFAASRMEDGVWPGGGVKTRFSTCPSAKTSTTSARSGARLTNSMCRIGASRFGASTRLAPRVMHRQRGADLVQQGGHVLVVRRPASRRSSR